ncbi:hypothetical protein MNB_SV-9-1103 [hydrothermal vent metagenome]|uniref:Uncharacterized protein n=1 Tax=hydrothermal vent metagenome TaxID=652676 RepID=A0A1W1BY74_9ZZZZ
MNLTEILENQDIERLKKFIEKGGSVSQKDIINSLSGRINLNEEFVQYFIDNNLVKMEENETILSENMRIYDANNCPYDMEDMEYMSDGMWIHKDDCWW